MSERQIDPRDLRRALGAFATGVTIVTTADKEGAPWGFTANSFTSVSLDPPLVLVCLAKSAGSYPAFTESNHFAINILSAQQREASVAFATPGFDRFAAVTWDTKSTGSPVLENVVAWLDCQRHEVIEAGDHIILMGHVVDYDYSSQTPLGYCRGAYVSFALAQEAVKAAEATDGAVRVGAIVQHQGALLLDQDPKSGDIRLPTAARFGSRDEAESLAGRLAAHGITADLPFLYSVYEEGDKHCIFYRGEVRKSEHLDDARLGTWRFIAFDEVPFEQLRDEAVRTMLQRFVREQVTDQFGLYVGDKNAGDIHGLW